MYSEALIINPIRNSCVRLWSSMLELSCKLPRYGECVCPLGLEKEGGCIKNCLGLRSELVKSGIGSSGGCLKGVWS